MGLRCVSVFLLTDSVNPEPLSQGILCDVGKTSRELKTRLSECKNNMRNRDERLPTTRRPSATGHEVCRLCFVYTDSLPLRRGGDRDKNNTKENRNTSFVN